MSESYKKDNIRQRERVHFVVKVLLDIGGYTTHFTESTDISMSGMLVLTDSPPLVGTQGKVTIILEFGDQKLFVHADCKIVRIADPSSERGGDNKYGVGLVFTDIDSESSINLYNIIKYQNGNELMERSS